MLISISVVAAFYFAKAILFNPAEWPPAAMAILPEEIPCSTYHISCIGCLALIKKCINGTPTAIGNTRISKLFYAAIKQEPLLKNKMEVAAFVVGNTIFQKKEFNQNAEHLHELVLAAFHASVKDSIDPMEKQLLKYFSES